nr:copia protein [Tanacetum cinerariifolium]
MKPFGYPVTIFNILDHLDKFEGKTDEWFLVGYYINSKAFRVFNSKTRKVKENMHIKFLENKSNVAGRGPKWLFDIDSLTKSMNYKPITLGIQTNDDVGIEINVNTRKAGQEKASDHEYILLLFMPSYLPLSSSTQSSDDKDANKVPAKEMKMAIKTKWVFRNKKDDRGNVVRNKARLVIQGYTQEEGIDYDKIFAPVARIEAIRLFLAYASFIGFIMYQMDVKNAFLYGTIEEEMMHKRFQMSSIGELTFFLGLQVKQKDDGIFISQDKYVTDILKKFDFTTVKTTSTPIEPNKALIKDAEIEAIDVHLYRSMIRSVIIFIYLKGQPELGLWYPKDSSFDLEAFSDTDYVRASLDRKSTTGGCQFLGKRFIS